MVCWRGSARPVSTGEESEALVELLRQLLRREYLHARGRKFDREGNAVETPADLGDVGRVLVGEGEPAVRRDRAIHEQRDRTVLQLGAGAHVVARGRNR